MARNLANAVHVMGASWDGPPIPLRRRYVYVRIPMGHWPYRPGCHCPKCHKLLFDRSEVGWCIICGSFGCDFCCDVEEWRKKTLDSFHQIHGSLDLRDVGVRAARAALCAWLEETRGACVQRYVLQEKIRPRREPAGGARVLSPTGLVLEIISRTKEAASGGRRCGKLHRGRA